MFYNSFKPFHVFFLAASLAAASLASAEAKPAMDSAQKAEAAEVNAATKAESKAEAKPESKAVLKAESKAVVKSEPKAAPQPVAVAKTTSAPAAEGAAISQACEDLKEKIGAKIKSNGVVSFTLEVVPEGTTGNGKVVGTCDGGKMQVLYTRN